MKIGRTVPPHGGNGKHPGGIPIMRPHHKDGLNTDRRGKPEKISESSIYLWHESQQELDAKFIVIISVTVNAVYCHLRGCKEYISNYRKSRQKWLRISGQRQVVQDLATQWIQSYPCKNKTSQETQRSLQKFLEPDRKPEVIYTDNSLEFGKACEDLSWNHCGHHTDQKQMGLLKEQCAE